MCVCAFVCVCRKKRTGGQTAFFLKCTPEPGPSCEHEGETEQEVILGGGLSKEMKGPWLSQNCPPSPAQPHGGLTCPFICVQDSPTPSPTQVEGKAA